jgi:hypothetical protein
MNLDPHDIYWLACRMPRAVFNAAKTHKENFIIAGGFIRSVIANDPVSDIDVFGKSKDSLEAIARSMIPAHGKLISTDNAFTVTGLKMPLQFIHRWTFNTPEEVVKSFDFTTASAAIWHDGERWQSLCDERFYPDLAARRLVYRNPVRNEDAGGSMLRVLKFYQRGYRIPLDSLGNVMARVLAEVDKRRAENASLKVAEVITGLLREVDPLVDLSHSAHLPDLNTPQEEKAPTARE